MAMKIQKGNVKYKDRNDIVCTYGIVDDGTQYYFMDSTDTKKFSNGNRIATTLLVEAVDPMVKTNNIGLIDPEGNVVIPFENKSIRPVNDDVIIVESAVPTTQSVIDAINLRNDPLAATKLVSTPATIKEKLNQQMGSEGRYLFNDQFSEATICDINGKNLVNNEKYSFIALANDKLYSSKNTVDSAIEEFAVAPTATEENVAAPVTEGEINVGDVKVEQQVIDNAMENSALGANPVPAALGEDMPVAENTEEAAENSETPAAVEENNEVTEDVTEAAPVTPEAPTEADAMESVSPAAEGSLGVEQAIPPIVPEADEVAEATETAEKTAVDAEEATGTVEETAAETQETTEAVEETAAETQEATETAEETAAETQEATETAEETAAETQEATETAEETAAETQEATETAEETAAETQEATDTVEETPVDAQEAIDTVEETTVDAQEAIDTAEETTVDAQEVAETVGAVEETPVDVNDELLDSKLSENVLSGTDNLDNASKLDEVAETAVKEETEEVDDTFTNPSPESQLSSLFNTDENVFKNSVVKTDSIVNSEDYYPQFDSFDVGSLGLRTGDTIMSDVAKLMQELISQNRTQKGLISQYKSKIEGYESQARVMSERYNEQLNRNEVLNEKLRELSSSATRLDSRNQILDGKVRELEKIATSQEKELKVLRLQLEGKQDLVKLLADAKVLLGAEDSYNYNDEASYYRRAA